MADDRAHDFQNSVTYADPEARTVRSSRHGVGAVVTARFGARFGLASLHEHHHTPSARRPFGVGERGSFRMPAAPPLLLLSSPGAPLRA